MFNDKPIIILAIAQTLVWACMFYLFPAMLLQWEDAQGWSRTQLTAAITLALFTSAVASPFAGRLIDSKKGSLMMSACTALGGVLLIALSVTSSLQLFYLIWGLMGVVFAGCLYEPCFALITRARGKQAKTGITRITLIAGFAGTISFPLAHYLAEIFGWEVAVRVFAAIVLLIALPLMRLGSKQIEFSNSKEILDSEETGDVGTFLSEPPFWPLALGFALLAIVHAATLQHLLPILRENGFTGETAVIAAACIGPMQVVGRLVLAAIGDRVSNHHLVIACFLFVAASISMLIMSSAIQILLVAFIAMFGAAYGTASILRPVIAREILGGYRFGAKSGVLAMAYLAGAASAPWLGSLVWSIGTYRLVLVCLFGLSLLGLLLYAKAKKLANPG